MPRIATVNRALARVAQTRPLWTRTPRHRLSPSLIPSARFRDQVVKIRRVRRVRRRGVSSPVRTSLEQRQRSTRHASRRVELVRIAIIGVTRSRHRHSRSSGSVIFVFVCRRRVSRRRCVSQSIIKSERTGAASDISRTGSSLYSLLAHTRKNESAREKNAKKASPKSVVREVCVCVCV